MENTFTSPNMIEDNIRKGLKNTNKRFHLPVHVGIGAKEGNALLDFPVVQTPVHVNLPDGSFQVPGRFAIYRTDTNAFLGSVSDQYKMVTHIDIKRQVDKVFYDKSINFTSTTYLINNGERAYVDYHFPDYQAPIQGDKDIVEFRMRLHNSLDGRLRLGFDFGGVRFECSNGMLVMEEGSKKSKKKHLQTLNVDEVLGELEEGVANFHHRLVPFWRGLASREMTDEQGMQTIKELIEEHKVIPKQYSDHIVSRWLTPSINIDEGRNAWSLYNAFTDAATHIYSERSHEKAQASMGKIQSAFENLVLA